MIYALSSKILKSRKLSTSHKTPRKIQTVSCNFNALSMALRLFSQCPSTKCEGHTSATSARAANQYFQYQYAHMFPSEKNSRNNPKTKPSSETRGSQFIEKGYVGMIKSEPRIEGDNFCFSQTHRARNCILL